MIMLILSLKDITTQNNDLQPSSHDMIIQKIKTYWNRQIYLLFNLLIQNKWHRYVKETKVKMFFIYSEKLCVDMWALTKITNLLSHK